MTSLQTWLLDPDEDGGSGGALPEYLFRYTDGDGLAYVVGGDQIRMNLWSRMNDPRESHRWSVPGATGLAPLTDDVVQQRIDNAVRGSGRLLSLTKDRSPHPDDPGVRNGLLHRGWARAALWAHYADHHRGVCMVFDTTELMEAVSSIPTRNGQYTTWGSLDYVDEPIIVGITGAFAGTDRLDDAIEEFLDQRGAVGRLYMTKNRDWSYESEVRAAVVYPKISSADLLKPLTLPLGSILKGVIFGEAYPAPRMAAEGIRAVMSGRVPEFYRMTWDGGMPSLHAV